MDKTKRTKRIIHKHAKGGSLFDFIGSAIITIITVSIAVSSLIWEFQGLGDIINGISSPYGGYVLLIVASSFGAIAIPLRMFIELPQVFRHWRQTPERAAAYKHLETASVVDLEARIHELELDKATVKSEISAFYAERSQLQKEHDARLAELDKQIDSKESALQKADYDSEIDLLEQLIRAQRGPRFFHRSANVR